MCHNHQHPISVYQANGYDPSHTTTLRNAFAADYRRRFRALRGVIRTAIVDQDCFGLTVQTNQNLTGPGTRAFDFPRSADKVAGFMEWLKGQELLEGVKFANIDRFGQSVESAWSNVYIQDSYERGVKRARYELNRAGFDVPPIEQTGGITASLSAPIHADRVGLLFTRVYSEMNGISNAMDQQISRVLAQGIIDGDNPRLLARKLNAVIDGYKLGDLGITDTLGRFIPAKRRAETLARTEIIRAHAEAQLVEYGNWTDEVRIKAEWATAGDNRVCERCASREGQVMTIDQARGMIPLHPNCRCIWLPFNQELVARRSNR